MTSAARAFAYDARTCRPFEAPEPTFKVHMGGKTPARPEHIVDHTPFVPTRRERDAAAFAKLQRQTAFPILASGLIIMGVLLATVIIRDLCASRRVSLATEAVSYEQIVVREGDTLWDIANTHAIDGCSTSDVVHLLRDVNDLDDGMLSVGEQILVPLASVTP